MISVRVSEYWTLYLTSCRKNDYFFNDPFLWEMPNITFIFIRLKQLKRFITLALIAGPGFGSYGSSHTSF